MAADVLLSDGSTVHIRPIQPEDADRIVALHSRFSDRTRYLRYFSPYPRIPARDLARFVTVDHRNREALVASIGDDLIAVGRYDRLGEGAPDAEVAFVVEDAHQGRGLGSILLEHLASAAQGHGITRFVAEVLPQNQTMLRVFSDAGYQISREYADGVVHLTFPIAPTVRSTEVQRRRERRTEAASMARLLSPRSVAVYGVRRDGSGLGAALLRHVIASGFAGPVYPIHPSSATLDGIPAYPSASSAPGPVDLALVATPAAAIGSIVEDAAGGGAHGLVVVSAGFAESGPEGAEIQRALLAAARAHRVRLVGPNALGLANTDPSIALNATVAPHLPERGRVGLFCQSAAMGIAMLAATHERGLGLSTFASVGNRADVSGNDLLQYWRDDPRTDVILLYLETFGNPHKFTRIARETAREKPIVTATAGASTHHPGLDAEASAALFGQSGVIRVQTVTELFDVGELLAYQPLPTGDRVGVVGNAAALVSLASGACEREGLITEAPQRTVATGAPPPDLAGAVQAALADEAVDTVLVTIAPPIPGADVAYEEAVAAVATEAEKPVVAVFVGASRDRSRLRAASVPTFSTVEEAARALGHVVRYAHWRRSPAGTMVEYPDIQFEAARAVVHAHGEVWRLLRAYGVAVLRTIAVDNVQAAQRAARHVGYPVAIKAAGPELRHRLDLGAVRLGIADGRGLRAAFMEIAERFGGDVLVQPMAGPGVACVVEVVDDPAFGPVVGFGLGGIASDLLGDRSWRAAPLTDSDARALVRGPRAAALLQGYRGAPPVDEDALVELLLRVGQLADENPEVKRLSLNPVIAHPMGVTVLHADISYGEAVPRPDTGPRRLS